MQAWIVFVVLLFISIPSAQACRCVEPTSPKQAYRRANAIVKAKVMSVTTVSNESSTATLLVDQAWKNDASDTLSVSTTTNCAFQWKEGEEYLLFLLRETNGSYSTARCLGNRELSKADTFLKWLRKNGKPTQR